MDSGTALACRRSPMPRCVFAGRIGAASFDRCIGRPQRDYVRFRPACGWIAWRTLRLRARFRRPI